MKRRSAGKLGRKPGVSEAGSRFKLTDYLVDPLPVFDGSDDFTGGRAAWGMGGNDIYGICGPVGDYHLAMANAVTADEAAPPQPDDGTSVETELVTDYFTYEGSPGGAPDPAYDNGVDLGQWLTYRLTHSLAGLPPIAGFAQVNDFGAEYQSAFHLFGGLYTGILVSGTDMNDFEEGHPWTDTTDTAWVGGHCVPHLARNQKWGRLITWGADQLFDWPWWRVHREEAYVIFDSEILDTPGGVFHGVAVAKLKEDITKLKGTLAA